MKREGGRGKLSGVSGWRQWTGRDDEGLLAYSLAGKMPVLFQSFFIRIWKQELYLSPRTVFEVGPCPRCTSYTTGVDGERVSLWLDRTGSKP